MRADATDNVGLESFDNRSEAVRDSTLSVGSVVDPFLVVGPDDTVFERRATDREDATVPKSDERDSVDRLRSAARLPAATGRGSSTAIVSSEDSTG
ncbi:hypothetical protein DV733_08185 [Halapricum salinum]|uniref:Uncharacterized protein n=1 Tax=Halapricum salinum TaxID=1457250 RepID=A0A4D6HDV1_9EURY|nr:hypothetical protein DV733_08185 [Halapricum salinum]